MATYLANRKKSNLFVVVPMIFMLVVTLSALALMIQARAAQGNWMLVIMASVLFALAIVLAWMGYRVLWGGKKAPTMRPIAGAGGDEE